MWIPQRRKVMVVWWPGCWWMRWRQTTNFHFSHCLADVTFILLSGRQGYFPVSFLPHFLPSFFLPSLISSLLLLLFLSFMLSASGLLPNFTLSLPSCLTLIISFSLVISGFDCISEILITSEGIELITNRYLLGTELILLTPAWFTVKWTAFWKNSSVEYISVSRNSD